MKRIRALTVLLAAGLALSACNGAGEECAAAHLDLAESEFGVFLPLSQISLADRAGWWHFTVEDNSFDPCADLSWIVLSGHPGGTEERSETVLFFHRDTLVGAQPLQARVLDVRRIDDASVTVTWRNSDNQDFDVSYAWDNQLLSDGRTDLLHHTRLLNLTISPPPGDGPLLRRGNARHTPWEQEMAPGILGVPMGDTTLSCDFSTFLVTCTSERPGVFPAVDTRPGFSEEAVTASVAEMDFAMPYSLYTRTPDPGDAHPSPTDNVPDESITRIGSLLVDTRGGDDGFQLGEGVARHADSPLGPIDRSRWPTDLAPWDVP